MWQLVVMARAELSRTENVPGEFYVDSTCIDCATCRALAPHSFKRAGQQSAVLSQPAGQDELRDSLRALIACPTASIGTRESHAAELKAAQRDFPLPVEGPVRYCGYHSEKSYGAASYLIERPEGNVLVDSPRFAKPLVRRLEELGGVRWMFLTHRDDVADHEKFRQHFGCERILHEADQASDTRSVEIVLEGDGTVELEDLTIIPVPGHTRGHCVLLYRDYLFTGDHLAYSQRLQNLHAFRNACWYSWDRQIESMERLRGLAFRWVLPGHGGRLKADADSMQRQLEQCLAWMREVA